MAEPEQDSAAEPAFAQKYLRWHIIAYFGAVFLAIVTYYFWPADRGLFIPILLWGCLVLAHFLYVRAVTMDESWVEERSEEISLNATDLSHIQSIRERHDAREAERANAETGEKKTTEDSG